MATLEDKILGGPRENYCSSDEGEDEPEDHTDTPSTSEGGGGGSKHGKRGGGLKLEPGVPPPQGSKWGGYSVNTGPKGVLRDWELYKEHEEQVRLAKEQELIEMVKASSLTCQSVGDEEKQQKVMDKLAEEIQESKDLELDELLMSDKVLEQFVKQRMDLMIKNQQESVKPKFGQGLLDIHNGDDFLKVIDESHPGTSVIIHIYDEQLPECSRMNGCLTRLSCLYPSVQFCSIRAGVAGVSRQFKAKGVPALLVYKGSHLVGNFVQLREEFGTEFFEGDVENFLIENGMIEDRNSIPALLAHHRGKLDSDKS